MLSIMILVAAAIQSMYINWPVCEMAPFRGYGDYNSYSEFHTGLDFRARPGETVSVPHPGKSHYVVQIEYTTLNDVIVVLSPGNTPSTTGWAYEHLDYSAGIPFSEGDVLSGAVTNLTTCKPQSGDWQHGLYTINGGTLSDHAHSARTLSL
jgi:hypothetical protein